ncbi:hypothetical protein ADILRU_2572 [Leifsonia rubra CMS 76R]|nr:hypothetical protein ADILRU_2572 [Leifsonia rubra CMS 76R]
MALAITALVGGGGLVSADAAYADELGSGVLSLAKVANVTAPQVPGATFTYSIGFGCSSTTTGCVDAVLTDEIPAPLVIVGTPLVVGVGSSSVVVTGNQITVAFADPVANTDPPSTGLSDSTTGSVQVTVQVPSDLDKSWDNASVVNTVELEAVNADPRTAQAAVMLRVPTKISASLEKVWTPATAEYGAGTLSDVTLTVANSSNIAASTLTVAEPRLPDAANNPFNFYDLSSVGAVTFPQGADRVSVDARTGGSWTLGSPSITASLPTGIAVQDVEALRFIFSSSTGTTISAAGTAGDVELTLAQRSTNRSDTALSLAAGGVRENIAQATVATPDGPGTSPDARDTQNVAALTATVSISKSFSVTAIPAGDTTTATISARNTSTGALTALTIAEPTTAGTFFSDEIVFDGFDPALTEWPAGATASTVTWFVNTGTAPVPTTGVTALSGLPATPALTSGQHITGFSIEYTGTIAVGAVATLGVVIDTTSAAAVNASGSTGYTNAVRATGTNAAGTGEATASADLSVWVPAIEANLTKSIRPKAVYAGGNSIVELTATTPAATSTVRPNSLIITEPQTPGTSAYWNAFDALAIGSTAVPFGSKLKIEYLEPGTTNDWKPVVGTSGTGIIIDATANAQIFSANLSTLLPSGVAPSSIEGLRFTFIDSDGFGVATAVKPAIVFQARTTLRDGTGSTATGIPSDSDTWASYPNCGTVDVSGTIDATTLTDDAVACDTATIIPLESDSGPGGPGAAPVIAQKAIDEITAIAQSRQAVGATLKWGVQSAGFGSVQVTDSPDPSTATVASTMFQAFDLKRIDPISAAQDPLIRWDAVRSVELYSASANANAGGWVDITSLACASAVNCVGNFPGYTLTSAQSADTIGVRITFEERADRAAIIASTGDPLAPPVGSGVANLPSGSYSGAFTDGRRIHLDLELRNRVRDDAATTTGPWVTAVETYNHSDVGVVRNTVGVAGFPATGAAVTRTAFDDITLLQTPPTVEATKTVSPANLTIPQPGIAQANYPIATYTTRVQNTSATNVGKLRLTDPSVCADANTCALGDNDVPFIGASYDVLTNPFEHLNLTRITIAAPGSAIVDSIEVRLWHRDTLGARSTTGPFTEAQAEAMTPAQLTDVIGVTTLFLGEAADGGTITPSTQATVTLRTQLRVTERSSGQAMAVGTVPNSVLVGVKDNVLYPTIYSQDIASRSLGLREGFVDVATRKDVTPASALIAAASTNVTVNMRVRSTGTVSPKTLSITDDSVTFFNAFTAVSAVIPTMPTGSDQVEIEAKVGGIWITAGPTTSAAAAIPAGVNLALVEGIRATFTRSDGAVFTGTNDVINVRFVASLRSTLRDGSGPVTSSANATAMPGETVPGRVSNTETSRITHDDLSDTATASDTFNLSSGTAQVAVEKTSIGQTAAGKEIPFSLKVRNTGTGFLVNPIITDKLPADGSLRFVASDVPIYSTTAGGALTVDAALVTRTYDPASRSIAFSFPPGSQLAPGETYTVTVKLEVKPGLAAGSVSVNGLQFTNDRQVSACTALNSANGRTAVLTGNTCATDNVVTVLSIGSFSAFKGVKSTLGTATNTRNSALTCNPDTDGYYRYPCAADSSIGATDQWKLQLVNGGTIGSTTLSAIDILPKLGDQGVVDPSARDSIYTPRFNGDVTFSSTVSGIGFEWYFTTDATVCTNDIYPSMTPCAVNEWKPSSALVAGTQGQVTGIKTVFDFSALPSAVLPPASVLNVNYTSTNVPSITAGDGRAPVTVPFENVRAWSSFGYYPTYVSGANPPSPEEPIKAGVHLAAGSLGISKLMTGSQVNRAPSSVTASVACTIMGARIDMGSAGALTLDAASNYEARIDSIPQGARCVVTEDGVLGWFGEQERNGPQTVDVAATSLASDDVPTLQRAGLVNTYSPTLLAFTGAQAINALSVVGVTAILIGVLLQLLRRRRQV